MLLHLEDPEDWRGDPSQVMEMQAIVRIHLFEAMIGNWDWHLAIGPATPSTAQLWNIDAVQLGDRMIPIPGDFDLSSAVTGWLVDDRAIDRRVLPNHPSHLVRQAGTYLIAEHGRELSASKLADARAHFEARRAAVETEIDAAPLDDAGRANLHAHVDAFYEALTHLDEILAATR